MSNKGNNLLLVACVIAMSSFAQVNAMRPMHGMDGMKCDSAYSTIVTREYGFVIPGISWVDINKLNDYLAEQGISSFMMATPTITIGGHKEIHRLIMESNLTLRFWRDNVRSNMRTSLFAGDMMWNNGVNLLPASMPAIFFPYIGLGAGLAAIHVRSEEKTLRQALVSSEPSVMLLQASFLLNAGIGADALLTKVGSAHGIALGVRGGYLFDPFFRKPDRNWYSDRVAITDVPLLSQNGPYIRLMIGGW